MALSPGEWNRRVPRTIRENVSYREWLLGRCSASRRVRLATVEACANDISLWINAFAISFNPDPEPVRKQNRKGEWYRTGSMEFEVGPFITYPFQDRAIESILAAVDNRHDLVIEKSRDMGASYLSLFALTWLWLFKGRKKLSIISKDANSVDDGSTDSLFWKVDFTLEKLPEWMKPAKFERTSMLFDNKVTGAQLHGFSASGKATIGGRSTAIFLDEFTQMKDARKILEMTRDNSKCRIFNFTHDGVGTEAYRLTERPDIKKLVMHWSDHPEKNRGLYRAVDNKIEVIDKSYSYERGFDFDMSGEPGGKFPGLRSPWYDRECEDRTPRDRAMNLDIDPKGSSSQWFDPQTIRVLKNAYAKPALWQGNVVHDASGEPDAQMPLMARADGSLRLWINPKPDGSVPAERYFMGCDPSEGRGRTPTCISIANERGEKVGSWVNAFMDPIDVAPLYVALAKLFKGPGGEGAFIVWETPGPGSRLGKYIIDLGYRNFYYHEVQFKSVRDEKTSTPGYSSQSGKKALMEFYRDALELRYYSNRCEQSLDDCLSWETGPNQQPVHPDEKKSDNPAEGGINHGDRVIADALTWMLVKRSGTVQRIREPDAEPLIVEPGSFAWRVAYNDLIEARFEEVWSD